MKKRTFKKKIINILCIFIPFGKFRTILNELIVDKNNSVKILKNKYDGKLYSPFYNLDVPLVSTEPEIYNKDGDRIKVCYIRDIHSAHSPYSDNRYFLFDRYNYALNTHFYTHNSMLEQIGKPDKKYGMLCESKGICPDDYKIFDKHKGLNKDFDLIFTYDEEILNKYENARFVPLCASVWYGKEIGGGIITGDAFKYKTKNISILSSDKVMCELHKTRIQMAIKCKQLGLADTYGTFDGGNLLKTAETLTDYRYSIAIENIISPLFFTEKITNCFAAMTVPIYIGATDINNFFNPDGIIKINPDDIDNLENVLKQCSEKDYLERLPAIIDNYNRVFEVSDISYCLYKECFNDK